MAYEISSAVKWLIASKINVYVYIIYVCVLCIFIMYKYTHMRVYISENMLWSNIKYIYIKYKLYEYNIDM